MVSQPTIPGRSPTRSGAYPPALCRRNALLRLRGVPVAGPIPGRSAPGYRPPGGKEYPPERSSRPYPPPGRGTDARSGGRSRRRREPVPGGSPAPLGRLVVGNPRGRIAWEEYREKTGVSSGGMCVRAVSRPHRGSSSRQIRPSGSSPPYRRTCPAGFRGSLPPPPRRSSLRRQTPGCRVGPVGTPSLPPLL